MCNGISGNKQELLGLLVRWWFAVLGNMVLVCLHGLVRSGASNELVAEAGLVVALDLWEKSETSYAYDRYKEEPTCS